MNIHFRTVKLSTDLSNFDLGSEDDYLSKLTTNIFSKYLDSYINNEMSCLRQKCSQILQKFYDSKKHVKKQLQSGGYVINYYIRNKLMLKIINNIIIL